MRVMDAEVVRVPRSENQKADALSKLASFTYSHLITRVLVEVLPDRSTEARTVK